MKRELANGGDERKYHKSLVFVCIGRKSVKSKNVNCPEYVMHFLREFLLLGPETDFQVDNKTTCLKFKAILVSYLNLLLSIFSGALMKNNENNPRIVVSVKNLSHVFSSRTGEIKALENISIEVQKGEFITLVGPSGCGKSTALLIIGGLLEYQEG